MARSGACRVKRATLWGTCFGSRGSLVRIQSPRPFQLKRIQWDALVLTRAPVFYRYSDVDDFVAVHIFPVFHRGFKLIFLEFIRDPAIVRRIYKDPVTATSAGVRQRSAFRFLTISLFI